MLEVNIKKAVGRGKRAFILNAVFTVAREKGNIVFFGPSGSGKTLTLQCLAGLLRPDSGQIKFDNRVLYSDAEKIFVKPQKRNMGYMPQDFGLFPHLTILQNVAYPKSGLTGRFLKKPEKREAMRFLEKVGLEGLAGSLPSEISGGQKQRASLARALNANPALLLLDEPFSSLDPLLRLRMRKELAQFLREVNLPLVVITHDPDDVEVFGEIVVFFSKGQTRVQENFRDERAKFGSAAECLLALQGRESPDYA